MRGLRRTAWGERQTSTSPATAADSWTGQCDVWNPVYLSAKSVFPGGSAGSLQAAIPRGSAAGQRLWGDQATEEPDVGRGGGSDHLTVLRRGPGVVGQQRAG